MSTISFTQAAAASESRAPRLIRRERRRAVLRLGWYLHAAVFLLVNLGLATSAWLGGDHAAALPSWGWSLGLSIHGAVVLLIHLRLGLLGLLDQMVEHERALRNLG